MGIVVLSMRLWFGIQKFNPLNCGAHKKSRPDVGKPHQAGKGGKNTR